MYIYFFFYASPSRRSYNDARTYSRVRYSLNLNLECTRAGTILKSSFNRTRRNDDTTPLAIFYHLISPSLQRMNSKESMVMVIRSKQPPCDSYPSMGHPL